ncbi:pyridoxamine 5'-phosphate oxidase family protein [Dactylosporangium sp. NBC_01737]|uniref:pyridoxamine 5'-phosphate oxidase family protein n=1 Tax=Dactylosporangium sp. NBC_01737 TaxID=2975959 RepID=UPI002E1003A8|nr:pyridoxamine 5'-phosphate oxidase family protein [Dactylosporangium sp. NBC_01737]
MLSAAPETATAIDAYRTCELLTLSKDGSPLAWPTSGLLLADGTFLITTSIGFPQKAFNVRRDARVAVLFSDPTASGLADPGQILLQGTATCPDEIHTEPTGDLAAFWARMFQRQPKSRAYLDWPATRLTDFYFMRLLITVTPTAVSRRSLPDAAAPPAGGLLGSAVLGGYRTAVLCARDASGAPLLVRTTIGADARGYRPAVPPDVAVAEGPASLLVHRHDAQLSGLHNANVCGDLVRDGDGWLLVPRRLIEPNGRSRTGAGDAIRTVRTCRATTRRYLQHRSLSRPEVPWKAYRAIRAATPKA